ncbi:HAMP domain-containing protein [Marinobacter nanhaiticus D15-8W]|uniref:HAMP domain-containing protein n=2 Tax=Marinobacter TaxID=2742 RepID=N6W030_9GAMM|nr:HAMP domain-containing protein [Marinobacter nanhaiticus D15-8W]
MKNWSLRSKLLLTSMLCLVVLTTAMLWLSLSSLRSNIDETLDRDVDLFATAFATNVSNWMEDRRNSLKQVAQVIPQNPDIEPYKFLDLVNQGLAFSIVYYGTEEGEMLRSDPTITVEGYDPRVRSWYKGAMANQGSFLTTPFTSKSTGDYVVTLAEPVRRNGDIIGVVGGNLTLDTLTQNVNELDVPGDGYAVLIDKSDQLVAHPDPDWQRKPGSEFSELFELQTLEKLVAEDELHQAKINGEDSLLFAVDIPGTNWVLVLIMDEATLMAPVRDQLFIQLGAATVVVIVAIVILLMLFKVLFRGLEGITRSLDEIASGDGDLTKRLAVDSRDEIGQLAGSFNRFVEQLHGIISRLSKASGELMEQADQSASSANAQHDRVQRHKSEIDKVATAVTEMASATQEIASNAELTADSAQQTVTLSDSGRAQVEQSRHSIENLAREVGDASDIISELSQHAQNINSILSTITGIAEQTNLLALNAAIEAARAGEHGRGFAVVADEVRVLSRRTHESTKEIENMIEALQSATGRAVTSMEKGAKIASQSVTDAEEASRSLVQISDAITHINDMAAQIAAAAEEQASVTVEINRNTETIREVGDEMAAESEVASRAANRLRDVGGRVHADVGRFRL